MAARPASSNSGNVRAPRWLGGLLLCCLCAGYSLPLSAESQTYFRVTNDNGTVELKSTISPEEAKRGYAIVTLGGHVIEEVAPQLTDEALDEQRRAQLKALREREKREQQQRYDENLLLKYSAIEDLEAEKKRKLSEFDVRLSILRSNMMSLKDQVERQQSRAADFERRGQEVPHVILQNIAEQEDKLRDAEASHASRLEEKQMVASRYDKDIARFKALVDYRQGNAGRLPDTLLEPES